MQRITTKATPSKRFCDSADRASVLARIGGKAPTADRKVSRKTVYAGSYLELRNLYPAAFAVRQSGHIWLGIVEV